MSDEQVEVELEGDVLVIRAPIRIRRRGGRKDVVVPEGAQLGPADGNDAIVVALARGHHWRDLLESGRFESMTALAAKLGVDRAYVRRMVQLTFLPPRVVVAALAGEDVGSLAKLLRTRCPRFAAVSVTS